MSKKLEVISKAEFARRLDITRSAVSNAIARGAIFGEAITEEGKLIFEIAKRQFEFNRTDRGRKKKSETVSKKFGGHPSSTDEEFVDWARRKAIAQAQKAEYVALQAELEYRQDSGELIERKLAVGICYQIAKHLTDSLRNLPDRLAQKTHAAYQAGGNEEDTRETMRLEIDTILHILSEEVKQFEI